MPNFSDSGQPKSFELDEAREFISFGTSFCWNFAIRHQIKETHTNNNQLSRVDFAYFASICSSYVCCRCEDSFIVEHHCPNRFSRQSSFHQDILTDNNFSILPRSRILLRLHQVCVHYGINSQLFFPCQCLSLERKFPQHFQEWWSKVFPTSSCIHSRGNSKRKRDSSTD